jgi:hypothetical protein
MYAGRKSTGVHFPPRLAYSGGRSHIVEYFSSAVDFGRRNGYRYFLLTPADFSQDLSTEERTTVRARMLADLPPAIYNASRVHVHRLQDEK